MAPSRSSAGFPIPEPTKGGCCLLFDVWCLVLLGVVGCDPTLYPIHRRYHGDRVPGFPQHPHRGFETVTATIDGMSTTPPPLATENLLENTDGIDTLEGGSLLPSVYADGRALLMTSPHSEGIIDHSDSLGNAGRYGEGDVQWMTAGEGVVHGENFPLVNDDAPNPCRFFQIWLNLPKKDKVSATVPI